MPGTDTIQIGDDGDPVKLARSQTPPGGFSGGNYPGGGGGGLGFGGFSGFRAAGSMTQSLLSDNGPASVQRRKFFATAGRPPGNGGGLSTSPAAGYARGGNVGFGGPPAQPSDTMPAMLTPGEFVVNKQAASDPQNAALLQQMNGGQGAQGAPQGLSRESLVELLMVLLGGQQGASCESCGGQGCQMCMGGKVPGYGAGGWVGKALSLAALIPGPQQPFVASGAMIANGVDQGQQQGHQQQEQDSNQAILAYLNDRARHTTPGYAFGGPVGFRPNWAGTAQNTAQPGFAQQAGGGNPGQAMDPSTWGKGFDPNVGYQQYVAPDPSVLSGMQEAGARDANSFASGVYNQAQLSGADPASQAAYKLQALAGAGRGSADALSKYRTDQATGELAYRRDIQNKNSQLAADYEKQRRDEYNQEKLKRIH